MYKTRNGKGFELETSELPEGEVVVLTLAEWGKIKVWLNSALDAANRARHEMYYAQNNIGSIVDIVNPDRDAR